MSKTMTMDEAIAFPFEELLRQVNATQESVRVVLSADEAVEIKPAAPRLTPLMRLPGRVREGWKDAIYEPKDSLKR